MHREWLLIAAVGAFLTSACTFNVHVSAQATVQGSGVPLVGNLLPIDFPGFSGLDLSQTEQFKNQGVSKNQVQSVKLTSAKLTITAPAGGTFDFLNDLEFDVGASNLPTKAIAGLSSIPQGATELTLTVDDVELAPYVTAASMNITTQAHGTPPQQDTTISAALNFAVVPKI